MSTSKLFIRKNDFVAVMAGKDKGKQGKVLKVDAKNMKLTKLSLDDLAKGADFHPYDPAKENEEYIRRAKDPIAELNDAPDWPSGLDPIKREGIKVLDDLVDATENARLAGVTSKKEAEIR